MTLPHQELAKKSSGPLVVDVSPATLEQKSPHSITDQDQPASNMATMTRKKRHGKSLMWALGSLIAVVVVFWLWESRGELERVTAHNLAAHESKTGRRPATKQFDVNAPPIAKSFWDSSKGRDEEELDQSSFVFWGQQSDRLSGEKPKSQKAELKPRTDPKKQSQPLPIIVNDDQVPTGGGWAVMRAADALMCRASVIDYVINATDLKDECDGLRKAFTKNCADDEPAALKARRRLARSGEIPSMPNPVIRWQVRIYHFLNWIRHRCLEPVESMPLLEEEILEHWDEAKFEVEYGFSLLSDNQEDLTKKSRRNHRRLTSRDESIDKNLVNESLPMSSHKGHLPNMTLVRNKVKLSNLALPTNNAHLSEKALSEALMFQQEDRISKAVQNQTNSTKAAAAEASASSKAVSDTAEYLSNVFNDPTSVEARTCCTSILNVFHENCNVDEEEELSDSRLFIVVAVIALCGLVKSLIRHFQVRWLPEAAGCILVGVFAGWSLSFFPHHDISFDGNWFLRIMVPPIVFEAALSIDKRSFNRHVVPIIMYAVIGTLIATGLTAVILHEGSKYYHGYCETIPFIESLTFGALISSIDPIAVLSVLSNMGMTDTDTIYVVIFGESLLNDGVSIVLFQTLVHFLDDNMTVDSQAVCAAVIHFLVVAVGSLLVGLGSGICCTIYYWMMHGCQTPLVEVLMFCCWALLPYYVCDGIEWSGIVAVVAAGFVMDINVVGQHLIEESTERSEDQPGRTSKERRRRQVFAPEGHLTKEAKTHIGFVTEIIATMMETAIFAYLGLFLFSARYHWNVFHTSIAIGACCMSRAVMIPLLSTFANSITRVQQVRANCRYQQLPQQQSGPDTPASRQHKPAGVVINSKMQLVLWFAGLRGAMSFALVEHIPQYDGVTGEGTRFKSELKAMTSACILFTVFVLGGCTFYMMEFLGLAPNTNFDANKQTSLDREMEMMGLLKSRSEDEENEWNGDGSQELYPKTQSAPKSGPASIKVRQRVHPG